MLENLPSQLLAAMNLAVFEPSSDGKFQLVATAPEWFGELMPTTGTGLDLVRRFPLLETFLPEALETWNGQTTPRVCSDMWTETVATGEALHLQAWAVNLDERPFLIIQEAGSLYHERQLVLQFAHETALQNDAIHQLNQKIQRASEAKSDFLALVSHEIRTPMNAIIGMADVLSDSSLSPDHRQYVDIFQRAASSLLDLLNDLLDISKIEAGRLTLENAPFDLSDTVSRVVELVSFQTSAKGLVLEREIEAEVPRWLTGDAFRLRQVLINLLGNSIKFTDHGRLKVAVSRNQSGSGTNSLLFEVSDTGIGIPREKLSSIFDMFTQADSSTTRKYGGTGLGLTISKRLVEAMGGKIWVESAERVGTSFYFTVELEPALTPLVEHAIGTRLPTSEDRSARILVADDSEDNQAVMGAYLRDTRYTINFVKDGCSALEELKTGRYDLALVDVHMPEMNGYELMRAFREYERKHESARLPTIAVTADAFHEALEEGIASGFTAYLAKPIRKAQLLESIGKYAQTRPFEITVDEELSEMLPKFIANLRRNPAAIDSALERGDFDSVRILGHNMKGTGSSFGLPQIDRIGDDLERAAIDLDIESVRKIEAELVDFLKAIILHQQ
jgi:signal transduction histidine kinase/DNA-binding NarL/FixJ family response regulator